MPKLNSHAIFLIVLSVFEMMVHGLSLSLSLYVIITTTSAIQTPNITVEFSKETLFSSPQWLHFVTLVSITAIFGFLFIIDIFVISKVTSVYKSTGLTRIIGTIIGGLMISGIAAQLGIIASILNAASLLFLLINMILILTGGLKPNFVTAQVENVDPIPEPQEREIQPVCDPPVDNAPVEDDGYSEYTYSYSQPHNVISAVHQYSDYYSDYYSN